MVAGGFLRGGMADDGWRTATGEVLAGSYRTCDDAPRLNSVERIATSHLPHPPSAISHDPSLSRTCHADYNAVSKAIRFARCAGFEGAGDDAADHVEPQAISRVFGRGGPGAFAGARRRGVGRGRAGAS